MVRLSGVDVPNEKRVEIALTYIHGIGLKGPRQFFRLQMFLLILGQVILQTLNLYVSVNLLKITIRLRATSGVKCART